MNNSSFFGCKLKEIELGFRMNSRTKLYLVVLACLLSNIHAQSLSLGGLDISWTNRGQQTDFKIYSSLGNGVSPSSAWMGIGFNKSPMMVG